MAHLIGVVAAKKSFLHGGLVAQTEAEAWNADWSLAAIITHDTKF